jgi:hypothetical protein
MIKFKTTGKQACQHADQGINALCRSPAVLEGSQIVSAPTKPILPPNTEPTKKEANVPNINTIPRRCVLPGLSCAA